MTVLAIFLVSCGRSTPASGLIVRAGDYASDSGAFSLKVNVTANGIVNYTVTDVATNATVLSDGGFSTYHRWSFYWDENDRLWTQNSDMGPFGVWSPESDGQWTMKVVDKGSPLLVDMPVPVYDHLPSTLKKLLDIESGLPTTP